MGVLNAISLLILIAGTVVLGVKFLQNNQGFESPILENTWWGPGAPGRDDDAIVPFKIAIADEVLLDLNQRLENARPFTPPLEGVAQDFGMNSNLLQEIVDFWKTKYDWKQREKFLNKYHQFKTQIQGLHIHYIHVKPTNPKNLKVVPLLLLHGWPGSVREFYEIIPMLTTPQPNQKFVFEVIVPSLPGYGFSEGATRPGLGPLQMAVVLKNLMQRLGFEKYYLQGGDLGSWIGFLMGVLFKDQVLGIHLNMCKTDCATYESLYSETGYSHLQATKPDTIGIGLNDSPVGLAAYILEKFITWTNPNWVKRVDGGLKLKFSYEDLLDNVMIYWVTNSITTSVRVYAEATKQANLNLNNATVMVPTACANMEHELFTSNINLRNKYPNLVQSNDYKDVGHFPAFEAPKILAQDIWSAVEKIRKIEETV